MSITPYNQAIGAYNNARQMAEKSRKELPSIDDETQGAGRPAFSDLVGNALDKAADAGYKSEAASMSALTGETSVEDLITAVTNAELALNTVVSIRDKVLSAYQDIIRMPV